MHGIQSGGRKAIPQMWVFGLELVLRSAKWRAGGAHPERQGSCSRGMRRLILLVASGQSWGILEAAACPSLLLLVTMRQLSREACGDGLAHRLYSLTASDTPTYNTRAHRSLFILL